ncbi:hypothetical protein G9C85_09480 [Halorubellus sp. JP-L1]|uniref:hypothetical protein n=1 Tax=Halorubellus sp. JP-L1 TaxID=2715753 RepID=UPI00140E74E1|nr:hypothetical protein [Halorubellus sp. JP-L1]NHN41859.1 hypothetical protein [Halorubellus sp. JP-L1]
MGYVFETKVKFGDTGDVVDYRREQIGRLDKFREYFDGAEEVFAVTYSDSPETLLKMLGEFEIGRLEVVVGNVEDYREQLTDKPARADRLERLRSDGRLVIYTCPGWGVHTKLYLIKHGGGDWTLIDTSANLSKTGWGHQTNMATVYETDGSTVIDEEFHESYVLHRDTYGEEFMQDLSERLEDVEDEEEREQIIDSWVDGRSTAKSESEELNERFMDEVDQFVSHELVKDGEDADKTIAIGDEGGGVDTEFGISLRNFDSGFKKDLIDASRETDITVTDNTLRSTVRGVSQYFERQYGIPSMWFNDETGDLFLQTGDSEFPTRMSLPVPESSDAINRELAKLEEYIETVDEYGETNAPEAVKAHLFEGLIWVFWAPFINKYASVYRMADMNLDKNLPYLYIHGESDAGKGTFLEFALQKISNGSVTASEDADKVGAKSIQQLQYTNTVFPYAVDDIPKRDIHRYTTLRNMWNNNWSSDCDFPATAFVSNDKRPKKWVRNRSKVLHFDVVFRSTKQSEAAVAKLKRRDNMTFNWFSTLMIESEVSIGDHDDTLRNARNTFVELYRRANRELPVYFPREPADKVYSTGRRRWRNAWEDSLFEVEERRGELVCTFPELERPELYRYEKTIPTRLRANVEGNRVVIGAGREAFEDWLEEDLTQHSGLRAHVTELFG